MEVAEKIRATVSGIEEHTAISDDEKVSRITHIACSTCAAVGIQPVPFADIFLLGGLQAYFATRVAAIRGVAITEANARDYIRGIFGVVGLGVIAEQFAIGVWKLATFGFGGAITFVLDYAMTFAVMKLADAYFSAKAEGRELSRHEARAIFRAAHREGKKKGATEKRKISARN